MTRLWRVERIESGGVSAGHPARHGRPRCASCGNRCSLRAGVWWFAWRRRYSSKFRVLALCGSHPSTSGKTCRTRRGSLLVESALRIGISEPSYSYTEVGTATGAFLLGQFLAPRKQAVLITRANVLSWPEIAEDNVVFLGPTTGIHQTDDIPMDAQLVLDPTGIRNLKPRAGEAAFIKDRPSQGGEEAGVSYALISRVPAMEGPARSSCCRAIRSRA